MATTEKTRDDVAEKNDPNTFLGVALGFAGLCLIAKEKLLLGTLSLVGGALIGLQSRQDQKEGTQASPEKGSKPKQLMAKPAAEKRATSTTTAKTASAKTGTAKPAPSKAKSKKADAKKSTTSKASSSQTASTKPAPAKAKTTKSKAASKTAQSKAPKPKAEASKTPKSKAAKPKGTRAKAPKPKAAKTTAKRELSQIEGIGPKITEVLAGAGIQTYDHMAQATPEQIRGILAKAGNRYRLADPTTWPEQAALAAAGKWDDLKTLQGQLKGGRRNA